ncbi:MAG: thiamine phosphate synthase [Parvibaculum sp.]|uniref:thiamine phosphate synthase n=1 Tax=Parvibaculum sp. TaxID=2024848 RepID=UPI0027194BBB|nr:thiamine phosphate synthase [Parvibaculum sp.]MDO8837591.1 thiamine phosphate synthase [Parvibaculum sp.]
MAGNTNGKRRGSAKAHAMHRAVSYLSGARGGIALIGMTDAARLSDPQMALDALPAGCALVWRAYDAGTTAANLRRLTARARAKNCLLLIAGEPKLSRRLGAGGLHLPERMLGRPYRNGYAAVTAAAHSEAAIRAAARAGAVAVLISPVFPTASHPGTAMLGVVRFAKLARLARTLGMTPYALGGITTSEHIQRLAGTGAAGVAGTGFLQT